jgi:hypothetical protein
MMISVTTVIIHLTDICLSSSHLQKRMQEDALEQSYNHTEENAVQCSKMGEIGSRIL